MASAIEIKNLSVRLGDFLALENINIDIESGDFVAILGPNGAGKSTLLKTTLGLIRSYTGEVRVFGDDIRESSSEWIGYIPQLKTLDRKFPALTCDLLSSGMRRTWPGR